MFLSAFRRGAGKNRRGKRLDGSAADYTLVIVDMQPQFLASTKKDTLAAVEREIRFAMEKKAAIIILEYRNWGPTNPTITDLTDSYQRCAVSEKALDDGSREILNTCKEQGFSNRRFRVCGVNTHACVEATVSGLAKAASRSRIEVVKETCNDSEGNDWRDFPKRRNIVLTSIHC